MNLLFSYSVKEDNKFAEAGHTFLGAGLDSSQEEVHVFLLKDEDFPEKQSEIS